VPRGQSNLAHSSVGWNNTSDDRISTSDEDEEQGHVAPAAALSEKDQYPAGYPYPAKKSRKGLWIGLGVAALIVAAGLGIGLGVG
jgi:glucan 1,3-beta-glucosidase